jgi:hypothetical protein
MDSFPIHRILSLAVTDASPPEAAALALVNRTAHAIFQTVARPVRLRAFALYLGTVLVSRERDVTVVGRDRRRRPLWSISVTEGVLRIKSPHLPTQAFVDDSPATIQKIERRLGRLVTLPTTRLTSSDPARAMANFIAFFG